MPEENRRTKAGGSSSIPYAGIKATESTTNGSPTEGSEKEGSRSESSIDADSEASESESTSQQIASSRACSISSLYTEGHQCFSANLKLQHSKPSDGNMEALTSNVSKLSFGNRVNESEGFLDRCQLSSLSNNVVNPLSLQNPQEAFQTLSQSYVTSSKECSVQSCLYQFTSVELLMGNNKLLCENCTEWKQKPPKKACSTGNVVVIEYSVCFP